MGLSSISGGYLEQPGIQMSQIVNPNLKWETNYNMNIGLDFGFWDRPCNNDASWTARNYWLLPGNE